MATRTCRRAVGSEAPSASGGAETSRFSLDGALGFSPVAGAAVVAAGVTELAAGVVELAAGVVELAAGVVELAAGVVACASRPVSAAVAAPSDDRDAGIVRVASAGSSIGPQAAPAASVARARKRSVVDGRDDRRYGADAMRRG